jgi:hypothetical protein
MVDNGYEHDYIFDWTKPSTVKLNDIIPDISGLNIENKIENKNEDPNFIPTIETNYTSGGQQNIIIEENKNNGKF